MTEITKWEYTTGDFMNSNLPGHKDINELGKSQSGAASWGLIQSFLSEKGIVYGTEITF